MVHWLYIVGGWTEEEEIDNGPDIHSGDDDNCSELSDLHHESDDEDDLDDNDF